jgi:TCP-1/cpn60 chaperonin family
LVQRSLSHSFACIVANSGRDSAAAVVKVAKASNGHGFDARSGETADMVKAGIIDPIKVSYCAVRNAGSVAALILTTQTLTAKKPDDYDVTAGPARGGGLSFSPIDNEIVGGRQRRNQGEVLVHHTDSERLRVARIPDGDLLAIEQELRTVGCIKTHDALDEGRLADAVFAEPGMERTRWNFDRNVAL